MSCPHPRDYRNNFEYERAMYLYEIRHRQISNMPIFNSELMPPTHNDIVDEVLGIFLQQKQNITNKNKLLLLINETNSI